MYPDGRTGLLWLTSDGRYTATGRRRDPSSGKWMIKAGGVCLKQLKPFKSPFNYCTVLPREQNWHARAPSGEHVTVRLVSGIVEPPSAPHKRR